MQKMLFIFLLACTFSYAQDNSSIVDKSFTIIVSTKNYKSALQKAQQAANDLQIPMNLRNCFFDKEKGLTNNEVCDCGQKHGYYPRGRYDDGKYISIELSSSYENFRPGYYLVIIESGERNELENSLEKVKTKYKDAYIKNSPIYMGCLH